MGKKRKKRKVTKIKKLKKTGIIILPIIVLIVLSVLGLIYYRNHNLKDIKKHYNKYIITTKKTNLYNSNYKKIGTIEKDYELELDELSSKPNNYYKIKNTDYYIDYKDTKKINELKQNDINNNKYIPFNMNVKTNDTISLKQDNKTIIELKDNINLPIYYQDKDNYYITFLNNLFSLKKNKRIKEVKHNNTEEKETDHVSILYYEKIEDSCSDYSCTTTATLKEELIKLKENGYYPLTISEYHNYLDKYIRLKEKALLLLSPSDNESINAVENELSINIEKMDDNTDLKLNLTNKKSTTDNTKESVDAYAIKSYTSIDNLLKMANGEEVVEQEPVKVDSNQGIAVINYHFFYDSSQGEGCTESICLDVANFREQLDYLKNNNYKTLTMNEFKRWMYGEIELPEKSVLLTIDDGAFGTGKHNGNKLIPILEEYKMHATLFLIAGWWDIENYRSPYLDIQSHTFDMHQYGDCGKGQINCATYEQAKEDLRKSLDIIKNDDSFCFPFYAYSDTSLQAVKDSGFKLAFVGGNRKATRNSNKFLIPRYPIYINTSIGQFINMVS